MPGELHPELGPNRLFFGGHAVSIDYGGQVVSEAELLDPQASPEQEAQFQKELDRLRDAERLE